LIRFTKVLGSPYQYEYSQSSEEVQIVGGDKQAAAGLLWTMNVLGYGSSTAQQQDTTQASFFWLHDIPPAAILVSKGNRVDLAYYRQTIMMGKMRCHHY
jgi:hypothetical protein